MERKFHPGVSAGGSSHPTAEHGSGSTTKREAEVCEAVGEAERALSVQRHEVGKPLDEGASRTTWITAGKPSGVDDETNDILADGQIAW